MNRHNNVCMECHTSSRCWIKCPKCQKPMICIGSRWRVPKKNDKRNWKILCERFAFLRHREDSINLIVEEH